VEILPSSKNDVIECVYVIFLYPWKQTKISQLDTTIVFFSFWKGKGIPFILGLELTVLQLASVKVMLTAWNIFNMILDPKVHLASGKFAALEF